MSSSWGNHASATGLVWVLLCTVCMLGPPAIHAKELTPVTESDEIDFGAPQRDKTKKTESSQPNLIVRSLQQMEIQRDWISKGYVKMWRGLDNYFSDGASYESENHSELRLELKQTWAAEGDIGSDAKLRVRVDLPNTEHKLKLFFSSDEDSDAEERVRSVSKGERIEKDNSVSGLEFFPDDKERKWKRKFSGGVRLRSSLVPYVKFRIKREWGEEDGEGWYRQFRQQVEYFDDDERWSESTEFTMSRPFGEVYIFNAWVEAEYKDPLNVFEFANVYTLTRILSERSALHYRIGGIGASQPVPRLNGVFYGLSWQFQLYEDWVFLGLSPEVFYPREENWGAEPTITANLEIFFAE